MNLPLYYYKPQGRSFRVYKRITENTAESIDVKATQEEAKALVYELNGWNKSNNNKLMSDENVKSTEIQLVQIPMIVHKLKEVGLSVTKRINDLNIDKQVATEDTIQSLKSTRAELNKEAKSWEEQRKAVKSGIMAPYDEFEVIYKAEIIDKYTAADAKLKDSINKFELKLRTDKKNNIIAYFNELRIVEDLQWLEFDKLNIEVGLSISEKKYKEQVLAFITKTKSDIALITSEGDIAAEIMVEYKQTLNASLAITTVRTRAQRRKQEAENLKLEKIGQREKSLRGLSMAYSDFSKTFNWVQDQSILVRSSDIESMTDEQWISKFAEVQNKINTIKAENAASSAPVNAPAKPIPTPEILSAPTTEEVVNLPPQVNSDAMDEEVFEASFTVTDTFPKLQQLKEFLQNNNYNYVNID